MTRRLPDTCSENTEDAPAHPALIELARLLARQAARDDFASHDDDEPTQPEGQEHDRER